MVKLPFILTGLKTLSGFWGYMNYYLSSGFKSQETLSVNCQIINISGFTERMASIELCLHGAKAVSGDTRANGSGSVPVKPCVQNQAAVWTEVMGQAVVCSPLI